MKIKNLTLFFILVFSTLNGNANVRVVPTSDLVALDRHIKATELVTHILNQNFYQIIATPIKIISIKNYWPS